MADFMGIPGHAVLGVGARLWWHWSSFGLSSLTTNLGVRKGGVHMGCSLEIRRIEETSSRLVGVFDMSSKHMKTMVSNDHAQYG